MSWLRIDDAFASHPKVLALTRADRWTWLEVLLYCARYRTEGIVPEAVSGAVRGATPPFLERCYTLHLLDLDGMDYRVHDWRIYNGDTIEERVAAYLEKHPDASGNEVQKAVGGNRKLVLAAVTKAKAGSTSGSGTSSKGGSGTGSTTGSDPVTRARAPSPEEPGPTGQSSSSPLTTEEEERARLNGGAYVADDEPDPDEGLKHPGMTFDEFQAKFAAGEIA